MGRLASLPGVPILMACVSSPSRRCFSPGCSTARCPRWPGCPMCASMQQPVLAETHHDMAGMDTAGQKSVAAKDACATGDTAHMAFCAVCLIVPPPLTIGRSAKSLFAYPSSAAAHALADLRPAPQAPPPALSDNTFRIPIARRAKALMSDRGRKSRVYQNSCPYRSLRLRRPSACPRSACPG